MRSAGQRLIEAGLNEAAVAPVLWVEYRASVGGTLLPGAGLTGPGAGTARDPVRAGAGRGVWMLSNEIVTAVIDG